MLAASAWLWPAAAQTSDPSDHYTPQSPATIQGQAAEAPPSTLTGEWDGFRTTLRDDGVDILGNYKNELASNLSGGDHTSATAAGQLTFGATIDMQKLAGVEGGTVQVSINYRHGTVLPVNVLMEPQEVFGGGRIVRLAELWYEQTLADDAVVLKLGHMPEGDFNSFPCNFMNLTFCGAAAGNLVGNYWLTWPLSQWAGWVRVNEGDADAMLGVYETNPRDLDKAFAPGWLDGATGVTLHAQVGWSPKWGGRLQGHVQAGVWKDTAGGDDVLLGTDGVPFALTGTAPLHRDSRYGYYVQAIQQLTGTAEMDPRSGWHGTSGLTVFANFIQADRATSDLDQQFAVGLLYAGPFPSRPDDHVAIAFGSTRFNARASEAQRLATPGAPVLSREYPIEAYYSYLLFPWLAVRPDAQYVIDPGGDSHKSGIFILGARTVVTL